MDSFVLTIVERSLNNSQKAREVSIDIETDLVIFFSSNTQNLFLKTVTLMAICFLCATETKITLVFGGSTLLSRRPLNIFFAKNINEKYS